MTSSYQQLETLIRQIRLREALFLLLAISLLVNVWLVIRLEEIDVLVPASSTQQQQQYTPIVPANNPIGGNGGGELHCEVYGGPLDETAIHDIVYWRDDIPMDQQFHSVYSSSADAAPKTTQYFVFEPDEAGFSNVRLSFETTVAFAMAMGRTLVMPPRKLITQLTYQHPEGLRRYSLTDFFNIRNVPTISMEEYLQHVAIEGGKLHDATGAITYPLFRRTNWDYDPAGGVGTEEIDLFYSWLSRSMHALDWNRDSCIIAFPANPSVVKGSGGGITTIREMVKSIVADDTKNRQGAAGRTRKFTGHPVPVNATTLERLREVLGERSRLCEYDEFWRSSESLYISGHEVSGSRPLIQFYAYLFFEDWKQDLQMKRFLRDNVRFADIIQCAAARIVQAIRTIARKAVVGNDMGSFDTMHVRRSDFKKLPTFNERKDGAAQIVADKYFDEHRTIYIATDEQDKTFFEPIRKHYTILFLDDFTHLLQGVDPNYFGMIEQLVCAKGDKFVGTYYSTFSAYVNRVRGYHALKTKSEEAYKGILQSEYMGHNGIYRNAHKQYISASKDFWHREWPIGWRDIDYGT